MHVHWWKFWRPEAWRAWRSKRTAWHQGKLNGAQAGLSRPVSPAWSLLGALLVVSAALPGEAVAPPVQPVMATGAIETTVGPTTTQPVSTSTTSTRPSTTTTSTVATTTTTGSTTSTTGTPTTISNQVSTGNPGQLVVHFIDVGQGDATLLQGPDFTILIDAGRHNASDVVPYLRAAGVRSIDLLIATHPHADHIGQVPQVLDTFPVGEVWMPGTSHTTQTFERVLDAILRSDAGYHEPRAGETERVGSLNIQVLSPSRLTADPNRDSIAVRVTFGSVSFLFTGDASEAEERAMTQRGSVSATILQVGHHGSRTSTSAQFLQAVKPAVAIYSAGANNQYGHPHPDVIQRLSSAGATVYGTAVNGTIKVTTNGSSYQVTTGKGGTTGTAVTTTSTTVPTVTTTVPAVTTTTKAQPTTTVATGGGCGPGQVNINTAGFDDLQKIIHIGPVRADEMLKIRPFKSVDDMVRIKGIAAKTLADIKAQGVACVP